jgi:hypothetical protein
MALFEATQKALQLQPLVGTVLNKNGLKVRAIMPAPVDAPLFIRFIRAVKDEVPNENTPTLYSEIAEIIGADNFEVAVLYEGERPATKYELLSSIKWEWYK